VTPTATKAQKHPSEARFSPVRSPRFYARSPRSRSQACTSAEQKTAGEIRVSILSKRTRRDKDQSLKQAALKEFYRLGMDKTRDKTGILLFIILKERRFQILADQGINEKVDPQVWDQLAQNLSVYFKAKKYLQGVVQTIDEVGKILATYFPIKADDVNELSDEVSIR